MIISDIDGKKLLREKYHFRQARRQNMLYI